MAVSAEYEGLSEVANQVSSIDDQLVRLTAVIEKLSAALLPLLELATEAIREERAAKKGK